jgi:hypothetical protein
MVPVDAPHGPPVVRKIQAGDGRHVRERPTSKI